MPGDERGATRRATLLGVVVGEHHAFFRDAVDTGRLVAHQAMRIGADVRLPDGAGRPVRLRAHQRHHRRTHGEHPAAAARRAHRADHRGAAVERHTEGFQITAHDMAGFGSVAGQCEAEAVEQLSVYIDGADEITPDLTLLKGRGYDLVREKLLARAARKFIVIADESKIVKNIGDNFPVPSEVHPFAWELVKNVLMKKGTGDIRINAAKDGYAITSCGNFVLDFNFAEKSSENLNNLLSLTPGIVEHGIFYNLAHGALISHNGNVREIWRS